MTNETNPGLERLSWLPDRDSSENGIIIAGQKYYDVEFTGGSIANVTLTDVIINGVETIRTETVVSGAGDYTVQSDDYIIVIDKTVPEITSVILPASPATGRSLIVKDGAGNAGDFNITLDANGNTIDDELSFELIADWQSVEISYNGTQWNVLNAYNIDGDVIGPVSSTDDAIALFDGTTGRVIQNSSVTISAGVINAGSNNIISRSIQADGSAGFSVKNSSAQNVLLAGAGGGINATAYGAWNYDGATASTIASFGASKGLESLSTATYPSLTELSYVKGVTSAIQTQINAKGSGTVTSASVVSANGFAGTVATATTTPEITLTTTITGLLKGNGTAISAASAGTDYVIPSGSVATLTTPRAIYGNNFDGSADLTQIIASTYGGTGNGFTKFSGAATTEKTYTLPNATCNILTDNAVVTVAQGGSGRNTGTTAYALIATGTTATGAQQTLANGDTTEILVGGGASALPVWTAASGTGAPVRATSPSLVTPNIGVATATSVNFGGSALNTYAENSSWTPTLLFGGGSTGITYSVQSGTYTRVGNLVFIRASITLSNKGSSTGIATVTGIPFSAGTSALGILSCNASGTSWPTAHQYLIVSGSSILLRYANATDFTAISDTSFTNSTALTLTACYIV